MVAPLVKLSVPRASIAWCMALYARSPLLGYLLALLLGLFGAWVVAGNSLAILHGSLMIDTDYPNAAAAFEVFVRDAWHWPLGDNPGFGGVNLFFNDGAPWFALLAKAFYSLTGLFVPFHGLVLINFLLLAVTAWRLATRISQKESVRWLIVCLLVFNLIMPVRLIGAQHIALGSYWVVLWAMSAVPMKGESTSCWRRWEFLATVGLAIWSHAYLGAMAITIVLVCLLATRRWWAASLSVLWPLALLYAIGALGGEHVPVSGAKAYALDLGAFTKSLGWGITGNLYDIHEPTQGDAIVYLGTGAWLLLLLSLVMSLLRRQRECIAILGEDAQRRRLLLMALASVALAVYAMAFDIRIAGHVLGGITIPSVFSPLYESFRVTGRFAAPLAYCLVILSALWWGSWRKRMPGWWVISVAAVLLQLADAWYAGTRSPPDDWKADAERQRAAVEQLLGDQAWSGHVFKDVGYFELEEQRLLDYWLVKQGARHLEVAHGARLSPEEVEQRSGYAQATSGDVVILPLDAPQPVCRDSVTIKRFDICLL